jgi:phosphatidylserine decarboxylase
VSPRRWLDALIEQDTLNFVLTNRIPRRLVTRWAGRFTRIEQPLVRDVSMAVWRLLAGDLNLDEARSTDFRSLHDCFIRQLKDGARPVDRAEHVLVSPCDAIVGAAGRLAATDLLQAKGVPYTLEALLDDRVAAREFRDGVYVTLRLTSAMYHRFHAPHDLVVNGVTYVPGDVWNVNPPAVKRVRRLYCRNERAVLYTRVDASARPLVLVAVGAILVAGIRLNFIADTFDPAGRVPRRYDCDARFGKGDELGYFEHGSTVIVCGPRELELCERVRHGDTIRMGEPLLRDRAHSATRTR